MTVHSFHIFDRRGKTLFTKRYIKSPSGQDTLEEQLSEQRKLIFGMLFSLRELSTTLSGSDGPADLQLVKTGGATLYNYETVSGLRFVLYTTAETSVGGAVSSSTMATTGAGGSNATVTPILTGPSSGLGGSAAMALSSATSTPLASPPTSGAMTSSLHGTMVNTTNVMTSPSVNSTIRNALQYIYEHLWVTFVVRSPLYQPNHASSTLQHTNFEASLDNYLRGMPWFP